MKKCFERICTILIIIALVLAIFGSETIKMQSFANAVAGRRSKSGVGRKPRSTTQTYAWRVVF